MYCPLVPLKLVNGKSDYIVDSINRSNLHVLKKYENAVLPSQSNRKLSTSFKSVFADDSFNRWHAMVELFLTPIRTSCFKGNNNLLVSILFSQKRLVTVTTQFICLATLHIIDLRNDTSYKGACRPVNVTVQG